MDGRTISTRQYHAIRRAGAEARNRRRHPGLDRGPARAPEEDPARRGSGPGPWRQVGAPHWTNDLDPMCPGLLGLSRVDGGRDDQTSAAAAYGPVLRGVDHPGVSGPCGRQWFGATPNGAGSDVVGGIGDESSEDVEPGGKQGLARLDLLGSGLVLGDARHRSHQPRTGEDHDGVSHRPTCCVRARLVWGDADHSLVGARDDQGS